MSTISYNQDSRTYQSFFQMEDYFPQKSETSIRLYMFSDVHYICSNRVSSSHRQWCDEITPVYSGNGKTIHNGKEFPLVQNSIHLCFKDDVHQIISSQENPLRFFCIGYLIDPDSPLYSLSENLRQDMRITDYPFIKNVFDLLPDFQTIRSILPQVSETKLNPYIIDNTLNNILINIFLKFVKLESSSKNAVSMKDSLVMNIIGYLHANIDNINALQQISNDMGYSYSYLSHLFAQKTGQTLTSYFTQLRMTEAQKSLQSGSSVTTVAQQLGYSSIHSFSRAYKAYFSCNAVQNKKSSDKDGKRK